jgi:peptidyl-prolyl cis-trans isomerase A (cyclophilin A)
MRIQIPAFILLLSLGVLSGCGGNSTAPYVSDIQANQLTYAQTTQFSVTGSYLDAGLNVTAKGCKSFTTPSAATNSGSTWNCVVDAVGTSAVVVQVSKATGEVLLSKSFDIPTPATPVVLSIKAENLMFPKSALFTMTGYSLDKDFNVSTKNCKGLALVNGGSSTSKSVTCNVGAVGTGAISFDAKMADGTVLKSTSFDVPNPQVSMVTNVGTLKLELNPTAAPLTALNYLQYVNDKFYDNTIIHRIVTSGIYVAQGGWLTPTPSVQPGQRAAIALEVGKGLSNVKGTIAMARGTELNSATSQFFFNLADNTALDTANGGYAVFGKVISGTSVLDALAITPTSTQYGLSDFPSQSVLIQSVVQTQ